MPGRRGHPCMIVYSPDVVIVHTSSHPGTQPYQSWPPNDYVGNIKTMLAHISTIKELLLSCL